jgi:hypothetical protein
MQFRILKRPLSRIACLEATSDAGILSNGYLQFPYKRHRLSGHIVYMAKITLGLSLHQHPFLFILIHIAGCKLPEEEKKRS